DHAANDGIDERHAVLLGEEEALTGQAGVRGRTSRESADPAGDGREKHRVEVDAVMTQGDLGDHVPTASECGARNRAHDGPIAAGGGEKGGRRPARSAAGGARSMPGAGARWVEGGGPAGTAADHASQERDDPLAIGIDVVDGLVRDVRVEITGATAESGEVLVGPSSERRVVVPGAEAHETRGGILEAAGGTGRHEA